MAAKKAVATPAARIVSPIVSAPKIVRAKTVAPIAETTALTPVMAPEPPPAPTKTVSPVEPIAIAKAETPAPATPGTPSATQMPATQIETLKTEGKSTMENAMKSTEEFVSFGQGNVEAMMKSGQIWATGLQDLSKHFAATAQASMDETMATVKAMSAVKSLKEAMDMQSGLAKTALEKMMAESGKLTDASMKLAEQAMAPLTARVTLATEKFGRTA